jgi:hypothetical protein
VVGTAGAVGGPFRHRIRLTGHLTRLTAVVNGEREPGVYRWLSRAHSSALRRDQAAAGWDVHVLDGAAAATGPDLLRSWARLPLL